MSLPRTGPEAEAVHCPLCEQGFRRVSGIHIGSQRLGMIPNEPCTRVAAVIDADAGAQRPFVAHIDGELLCNRNGAVRHFPTAFAAVSTARKIAPRRWHS